MGLPRRVRPDKGGNHFDTFLSTLLLHAESPSEPELRYRLSSPTDDWAKREDGALLAAASAWREQFSKSQNRPFWWNSVTDEGRGAAGAVPVALASLCGLWCIAGLARGASVLPSGLVHLCTDLAALRRHRTEGLLGVCDSRVHRETTALQTPSTRRCGCR